MATPASIAIFGTTPIAQTETDTEIHPSDHYGLLATFQLAPKESDPDHEDDEDEGEASGQEIPINPRHQPTPHTALVIIPPREYWDQIEAIRLQHMTPTAMPHITLLFRFWPEAGFPEALEMIREKLDSWSPFQVTLRDFGYFTHDHTCTAFATPEAKEILPLQDTIQRLFPKCDEVTKRSKSKNFFFFFFLFIPSVFFVSFFFLTSFFIL